MRTIASTFSTSEQAEQASRRLLDIGITPDRILMKQLPEAAGGIFISAKVEPEQLGAATEILKASPPAVAAPPAAAAAEPAAAARPQASAQAIPASRVETPRGTPAATPPRPHVSAAARNREVTRYGRYIVIFCLVLVLAFMAGAMLGLVT